MEITVNEFLGMALDNTFDFAVYDFSKEKNIFQSIIDNDMPDNIGDMYVESWDIRNGIMELNVTSDEE